MTYAIMKGDGYMLGRKKVNYEEIINREIKRLEEARLAYFNKTQRLLNDIINGNIPAYDELNYAVLTMNQYTYQIELLKSILKQARA